VNNEANGGWVSLSGNSQGDSTLDSGNSSADQPSGEGHVVSEQRAGLGIQLEAPSPDHSA
jgi:hypothetical protein